MQHFSLGQKAAAWAVHSFTSLGIVAGFLSIVAVSEGNFFAAFTWLLVAFIIDGVDGTFARIFQVEQVLPYMHGKTIDYVVDFTNYAVIPAYIVYAAPQLGGTEYLLPDALRIWAAVIMLLVSALYYGKDGMVSDDYYFIGFPVMWNFVAFYLYYVFALSPMANFITIVVIAILHFVPIKYLYPSRTRKFMALTLITFLAGGVSGISLVLLIEWKAEQAWAIGLTKFCLIFMLLYNLVLSLYHTYFDKETKSV